MGYGNGYDNGASVKAQCERRHGVFKGKSVFDSSQTIHVWAQQSQPYGRNAKATVWFEGATLYSYRTPIAKFVKDRDGASVVLVSGRKYSVTTSGQQSTARYAVRGKATYIVDDVESIDRSIRALVVEYDNALRIAADTKRRANTRIGAVKTAQAALEEASNLAYWFACTSVPVPEWSHGLAPDLAALTAEYEAAEKRKADAKAAKEAEELAKVQAEWPDKRADFLAGASRAYGFPWQSFPCLLQVWKDRDCIRTSWGAEFPINHGVRALRLICAVRKAGRGWTRGQAGPRLGHFTIDAVDHEGNVKAGCHAVPWSSIEHVARKLGIQAQ